MPPALACVRVPPRWINPRRAPRPFAPRSIRSIVRDSARAAPTRHAPPAFVCITGARQPAFPNPRRMPPTLVCVRVPPRLSKSRRAPRPFAPRLIRSLVRDGAQAAGDTEKIKDRPSVTGCVRPNARALAAPPYSIGTTFQRFQIPKSGRSCSPRAASATRACLGVALQNAQASLTARQ